jgi:hypothetical protein
MKKKTRLEEGETFDQKKADARMQTIQKLLERIEQDI